MSLADSSGCNITAFPKIRSPTVTAPKARKNIAFYVSLQLAAFARYARKCASLGQKDLASRVGVSQARISQFENAVGEMSVSTASEIALACGGVLVLTFKHDSLDEPVEFTLLPDNVTKRWDK